MTEHESRLERGRLVEATTSGAPHAEEAERGVLGCIVLNAMECVPQCQAAFKSGSDVFHDLRHRSIYEVACELFEQTAIVDVLALTNLLRRRGQLEAVGGVVYVASLADAASSPANVAHYVRLVAESHALRRMIAVCRETITKCKGNPADVEAFLDETERAVLEVGEMRRSDKSTSRIGDAIVRQNEAMEEGWKNTGTELRTGFAELDSIIGGMSPGELITIGAGSSEGKTVFLGNIAANNARDGVPCAVFSFEMSAEHLTARLISAESGIAWKTAQKGMDEADFAAWANTSKKLSRWPLQFCYCRGYTIGRIKALARRMVKDGVRLIGIDYLQLVQSGIKGRTMRHEEVGYITGICKEMAGELGVPVILLSQLSREHKKKGERPQMHDLRESGSIEHDSDKVLFLYRTNLNSTLTTAEVAKHRNGPKGRAELNFNAPLFRFETLHDNVEI